MCREGTAVGKRDPGSVGAPGDRLRLAGSKHVEARGSAHDLDQRRRERAVLDDPGERSLADLVGGKCDRAFSVAVHVHHFDRRNPICRKPLPRAEAAKKLGAAGADGVDTLIPVFGVDRTVEGRDCASFQQRDTEPVAGKGHRERHADQSRTQDDDVVVGSGRVHLAG